MTRNPELPGISKGGGQTWGKLMLGWSPFIYRYLKLKRRIFQTNYRLNKIFHKLMDFLPPMFDTTPGQLMQVHQVDMNKIVTLMNMMIDNKKIISICQEDQYLLKPKLHEDVGKLRQVNCMKKLAN